MESKPRRHLTSFSTIFHPGYLIIQSALCLGMGITLALLLPAIPLYVPLLSLTIFGLATLLFRTRKVGHLLVLLFICSGGTYLTLQRLQIPAPPHVRTYIHGAQNITCSGVITEAIESNGERAKLIIDLTTLYSPTPLATTSTKIEDNLFSTATTGLVQLSMNSFPHTNLKPGHLITVHAHLSPPRGFANPGGFNLPFFLQSRNIYIRGWVPRPEDMLVNSPPLSLSIHNVKIVAERIRSNLIFFYTSSLSPTHASLYKALITGDRSSLTPEIQEMFRNLGVYHLLAISGIHMGILAGFIMWLATKTMHLLPNILLHIPAKQGAATLAILPIILYCFISGLNPPAVRACLMTIMLFSAFIFRKQWHGPTAIATAGILILLHNPLLLAMVSFQLSFIAVTAIVLILPLLKEYIFKQKGPETILSKIQRGVMSGLLISLVASIATLPLLLFHFNRFSIISPFTTLVMEPFLCLWALGFGLCGSFFSFFIPSLATPLLQIGSLGFDWCLWLGYGLQEIPFLNLWLPAPELWKIALYYFTLFLFFLLKDKKTLCIFMACFMILIIPGQRNIKSDTITIIDVGKGNSSLIQCSTGETILIDCGGPSSSSFDIGRQIIAPYLFNQRIRRLDLLILSHADLDHYSGAAFLIQLFKPKELWIPYRISDNEQWDLMVDTAQENNITIRIPTQNESYPLADNKDLRIISATHLNHKNWSQNEQSLVARYTSKQYTFLFPGDIEEKAETLLLSQNGHLQSTVLIAPHHGSKSSSSMPFIKEVQPEYVVFSASQYGHAIFPAKTIVKRYTDQNSIPLKTASHGAITFTITENNLKVSTVRRGSL